MRLRLLLLVALPLLQSGCFAVPLLLAHDKILGPLSPAGTVRGAATGDDFEVTAQGVRATPADQLFRPYPRNLLQRFARPLSFQQAAQGFEAGIRGLSYVVMTEEGQGVPVDPEALAGLERGHTAEDVLEALGSPQLWIRRKHGSLMAYRADVSEMFSFYVGIPPFVGQFIPVPGLNNLSFRYTTRTTRYYKTLLFFDAEDRLLLVTTNEGEPDAEAGE